MLLALEVALPFLAVAVQVLADRLFPWTVRDLPGEREFGLSLLERLKRTLLILNAVFNDAEEKQMTNPFVKNWVDNLRDAVYDAEELLDELESLALRRSVALQRSVERATGEWSSTATRNQVDQSLRAALAELIPQVERTVTRIEDIERHKDVLGLKESGAWKPSPRLPTTSSVDKAEVCGREKDQERIKKYLLSQNITKGEKVPIIAIVGTGGVGKTTLAQFLYNDSQVKIHFTMRVWVHVSEKFDVYQITRTIYESITWQSCTSTDLGVMQMKLEQILEGTKLLLVLDDVWNENHSTWDFMINLLKAAECGSRIIVTTRNQGVASTVRAIVTYPLCRLSDEDCQAMLFNHAFREENSGDYPELEDIGDRIAKRCDGLPLAAKTLGSLLHSQFHIREWRKILNCKIWELPAEKSNILPSLAVSYYHLPSHLKQCFAYCSIFPKDHKYRVEELVPLWMAQGFLQQPRNERSIEYVGHEYFHELVSRSFFQLDQNGTCFVMHHLVNELAQFASGEYCCRFEECRARDIPPKTRHFSYVKGQFDDPAQFQALGGVRCLRTFLPLSQPSTHRRRPLNQLLKDLLSESKYLRVLSLSDYSVNLPSNAFRKLQRLRYLDFSRSTITTLPSSICHLYMLQSLLLFKCSNLIELPERTWELISLRCLDVTGTKLTKMPPRFGRLTELQMLSTFVVSMDGSGSSISELGDLSKLSGKLSIIGLQHLTVAADAAAANLGGKEKITELDLKWSNNANNAQNQKDVLEELRPNNNIEKIVLKMYRGMELPHWLGDSLFSKMASLSLKDCCNCTSLALLRYLPSLKELQVDGMEDLRIVGPEPFADHTSNIPFRSLEKLSFLNMSQWTTWLPFTVESQDFPSLQELTMSACRELTGSLPSCLPSLTSLCIGECLRLQFPASHFEIEYPNLRTVHIYNSFGALTDFPLNFFSRLENLEILDCNRLESFSRRRYSDPDWTPEKIENDILERFPSVKTVSICSCPRFPDRIQFFRDDNQLIERAQPRPRYFSKDYLIRFSLGSLRTGWRLPNLEFSFLILCLFYLSCILFSFCFIFCVKLLYV